MNADLSQLLVTGAMALIVGVTALTLLVRKDLLPSKGPGDGGGRWFLMAALGMGLAAFALKLTIVAVLSHLSRQTISAVMTVPGGAEAQAPLETPMRPAEVQPAGYVWSALPERAPSPPHNPPTPEKEALGRRLFFDARLSIDGTVSCASCHDLKRHGGADGRPVALGVTRVPGPRNVPTVWNAAFQAFLFWDGRAASLEEQARGPLLNPDEMGMPSAAAVEDRVRSYPEYRALFKKAFGPDGAITMETVTAAIACYERTLITPDAPYDRYVRGDVNALSEAQRRGLALFQSTGCIACHSGPNFSGASLPAARTPFMTFPNFASSFADKYDLKSDKGRAPRGSAQAVWRVPSLRNVALTAPYFHNGSVEDLAEAVRIMATAQAGAVITNDANASRVAFWSDGGKTLRVHYRRVLTDRGVEDITAFLKALTSDALLPQGKP
jgi:cytochrome c peroxidase